jgi:hypothetical protein
LIGDGTMRRGGHRLFVERTTNHNQAWNWRIVNLRTNQPVAGGREDTREAAIAKGRAILNQLAINRGSRNQ